MKKQGITVDDLRGGGNNGQNGSMGGMGGSIKILAHEWSIPRRNVKSH